MRRSQELPPRCPRPTHELLQLLTRPWTMHILWVLSASGPTRFGALRRQIDGISSRQHRLRRCAQFCQRHREQALYIHFVRGLVDHADAQWPGPVGVVPNLVRRAAFDGARTRALVCGPEVMMRFALTALERRGVSPERIALCIERSLEMLVAVLAA